MKIYDFKQTQWINSDIDTVWNFFSSPRNLNKITPPDMKFQMIDITGSEQMHHGQLIKYKVSPFPFLRVSWLTEIIDVEPPRLFADNQRKGPFTLWYHQHVFSPMAGGVEMTDQVRYAIPFGLIGRLANAMVVQHRVRHIFDYRKKQIEILFPNKS